jgi:hypothetical protein
LASTPESAHYRPIADALEDAVAQKIDRIAEEALEEDVLDDELIEDEEDDDYDEFDWTTE